MYINHIAVPFSLSSGVLIFLSDDLPEESPSSASEIIHNNAWLPPKIYDWHPVPDITYITNRITQTKDEIISCPAPRSSHPSICLPWHRSHDNVIVPNNL